MGRAQAAYNLHLPLYRLGEQSSSLAPQNSAWGGEEPVSLAFIAPYMRPIGHRGESCREAVSEDRHLDYWA